MREEGAKLACTSGVAEVSTIHIIWFGFGAVCPVGTSKEAVNVLRFAAPVPRGSGTVGFAPVMVRPTPETVTTVLTERVPPGVVIAAVIVDVPAVLVAVTRPLAETVATLVLLEVHVGVWVKLFVRATLSCCVAPGAKLKGLGGAGLKAIVGTGYGTVKLSVAVLSVDTPVPSTAVSVIVSTSPGVLNHPLAVKGLVTFAKTVPLMLRLYTVAPGTAFQLIVEAVGLAARPVGVGSGAAIAIGVSMPKTIKTAKRIDRTFFFIMSKPPFT